MSVHDRARPYADRRRNRPRDHRRPLHPRHWVLWDVDRTPRRFAVFAVAVDAAAVVAVLATAALYPVTATQLVWLGVLAALSVAHLESNRRIERMRQLASEGVPYVDLKSIWTFAGLLVLPPPLVVALIVLTFAHSWWRLGQSILPSRWVVSAATIVLASTAAGAVLASAGPLALPPGWSDIGVIAVAAVARWAVNSGLITVALPLMRRGMTWRQAMVAVFGNPADDLVEFAALSLGVLVAAALTTATPLLAAIVLPVLAVGRGLMVRQLQHAAQRDQVTGLLRPELWYDLARKRLERAERLETTVGLLLVRVDRYGALVDRYGEAAAELVLRAAADTVRAQVREDDLVGRQAGEEFVVLLPDVPTVDALAKPIERIRAAVRELRVPVDPDHVVGGLTVSVGGALYPDHGATLEDLLTMVDNAVFAATTYLGDQVRLVRTAA